MAPEGQPASKRVRRRRQWWNSEEMAPQAGFANNLPNNDNETVGSEKRPRYYISNTMLSTITMPSFTASH
jgi:hypothetical protein